MPSTTMKVSIDVPSNYHIDVLNRQLTEYAKRFVATPATKETPYQHESLKGIFASKASKEELVNAYLKDRFDL